MTSLAALPLDVLDQILSSLSDFKTLQACIRTCSTLRRVYDAHPNSILKSVAINLLGSPALVNAAWRSILVERKLDEGSDEFVDDQDWIESQLRLVASSEVGEITWPEAHALEERARVCMDIETIYSLSHKDKLTAETSRMSPDESEVFRMALLRLWYFFAIISSGESAREAFDEFETRQAIFYSRLSNQELYELQLVILWLDDVASLDGALDGFTGLATAGLKGFLEAHRTNNFEPDEDIDLDWAIDDDFDSLWHDRKIDPPSVSEFQVSKGFKPLLSTRIGLDDACTRCDIVLGLNLYNCQNWATKRALRFENTRDLSGYLPGGLCRNVYERQMFWNYVENPLSDCAPSSNDPLLSVAPSATGAGFAAVQAGSITAAAGQPIAKFEILNALFHLDTITTDEKLQKCLAQDGYADIEPDDWLCYPCLSELLRARLWIWWYNEKASGRVIGSVPREDCWYGYECRTQTKPDGLHAQKLNHLCVSTNTERLAAKRRGLTLQPVLP